MKRKTTNQKPKKRDKFLKLLHRVKNYEWALILATAHSLISIPLSSSFFISPGDDELLKRNQLLINILFFIVMFFAYWGIIFLCKNRQKYKNYIKFGLIYFFFLMIVLALVWPGIWRGPSDEIDIALEAQRYAIFGWQHSFTSIFFMLSYKLIPIFSGVIVIQCAIISAITSYIYTNIAIFFNLNKLFSKILLLIPFILPPIIDNALYPMRPILFSYFLILATFIMIETIVYQKLQLSKLIALSIFLVIICAWRSEGIYYLIIATFFFIYVLYKRFISPRIAILSIAIIIGGTIFGNLFQNSTLTLQEQQGYKILSTTKMLVPLVEKAHQDNSSQDELSDIDKVIHIQDIIDHKHSYAQNYYFSESLNQNFSSQDYSDYMKAFLSLCFKYPQIVTAQGLRDFAKAASVSTVLGNTVTYIDENKLTRFIEELPDEATREKYQDNMDFVNKKEFLISPWNTGLRETIIELLEGRRLGDYANFSTSAYITWNIIIPILITIITCIFLFIKKHFAISLIASSILIKTALTAFTSPLPIHMYYHAEYILGYLILFALLAYISRNFYFKKPMSHKKPR